MRTVREIVDEIYNGEDGKVRGLAPTPSRAVRGCLGGYLVFRSSGLAW